MKKKLLVALMAAVPLAAQATDGYFSNGYGMKSNGMGGAAIAVAMEPFGGAINPGAMSFLDNQWQLGVAWFSPTAARRAPGRARRASTAASTATARTSSFPNSASTGSTRPTSRLASPCTATAG